MTQFGFSINNGPMLQFKAGYDLIGEDFINFDELLLTLNASTYWGDQPIVSAKLIKVDSENEVKFVMFSEFFIWSEQPKKL